MSSRERSFRGGWSSSICDLFTFPRRRENCCALACCGLLLSDRNAHLMLPQESRPAWTRRFGINVGIPVLFLLVVNVLYTFLANPMTRGYWEFGIFWSFILMVSILLWRAQSERIKVRQAVMRKMYESRFPSGEATDLAVGGADSAETYLQLHQHDVYAAHALCSCFPKDVVYKTVPPTKTDAASGDTQLRMETRPKSDVCSCIFNFFSGMCFGVCGSWLQCCGMCAIGQEAREIEVMLDKKSLQVDYITFQPFAHYYAKILELRASRISSLTAHWRAISKLSSNLLKFLFAALLGLTICAVLELSPKFQLQNLVVVIATFAQAFLVLYFVHWHDNRFDLSFDALVKYFASGFCLCTFLAIVYEMMVSSVLGILSQVVIAVGISGQVGPNASPEEIQTVAKTWAQEHVGVFSIFVFLNAFIVAAMVEELSKYFGYFMVETPDLMDPDELVLEDAPTGRDSPTNGSALTPSNASVSHLHKSTTSFVSRGAGTTVAMVAVATGFACSENLLYVFIYTPPGITNEIATLVARSMFPIHPLCAAIQSLGVVNRDLLQDERSQLGRIILPAVILHGAFDFVLMLLALIENANKPSGSQIEEELKDFDTADLLPLIISVSMVIVGIFYYTCLSVRQRKRLQELDSQKKAKGGSSNSLV